MNTSTAITAPDGAQAIAYTNGAQVTSWIPAGGDERLFLSDVTEFGPGAAFRGGVPVIFPQFGGFGPLQSHGFARGLPWDLVRTAIGGDDALVAYALRDSEATRQMWDASFLATLTARVSGQRLRVTLAVDNTGPHAFGFTAALHTYVRVRELAETTIEGLGGWRYRDHVNGDVMATQNTAVLGFPGEVDRIYGHAPSTLIVREPERELRIEAEGFPDAVIWTPWESSRGIKNLQPGGYRHFICVEAAVINTPVTLIPGARWEGSQTLIADATPPRQSG